MTLNVELYGEPDKETYLSLLHEKLDKINSLELDERGSKIRDELRERVGNRPEAKNAERFTPEPETIEWMHEVSLSLYEGLLKHIPEQESFNKEETQQIFQSILTEELGDAAQGWRVDIEPAKAMNIKATEKRIVLSDTMQDVAYDKLRRLVVHEIGVHVLRSVMGGETDLDPLKSGLFDYYEAEEGLGVVMEQALDGAYAERGVPLYISAGLLHHDKLDFRDAFETKWRLNVLDNLEVGSDITDQDINKARKSAYDQTLRFTRGTDEIPWFKDLAYYNGSTEIWKYLEDIRGDDVKFMFTLMGKADPTNPVHLQVLYEVSTP